MSDVYEQSITPDSPFPQVDPSPQTTQANSSGVSSQSITPDNTFPSPQVARQLISTSLNTKTLKILKEYQFAPSGALQIGLFTPGISGDIRISPDGFLARDQAGNTTVAIDGDTGDATFGGTILAKNFVIADENGLVSAANFQKNSYNSTSTVTQSSGFSAIDVSGSTLTFTLVRPTQVLISMFANVTQTPIDGLREYHVDVWIDVDGVNISGNATFTTQGVSNASSGITLGACLSISRIVTLAAGPHTIKMRWDAFSDNTVTLRTRGYDYCMLGS